MISKIFQKIDIVRLTTQNLFLETFYKMSTKASNSPFDQTRKLISCSHFLLSHFTLSFVICMSSAREHWPKIQHRPKLNFFFNDRLVPYKANNFFEHFRDLESILQFQNRLLSGKLGLKVRRFARFAVTR